MLFLSPKKKRPPPNFRAKLIHRQVWLPRPAPPSGTHTAQEQLLCPFISSCLWYLSLQRSSFYKTGHGHPGGDRWLEQAGGCRQVVGGSRVEPCSLLPAQQLPTSVWSFLIFNSRTQWVKLEPRKDCPFVWLWLCHLLFRLSQPLPSRGHYHSVKRRDINKKWIRKN